MFKVALLGRPNVGKSTLFNSLTQTRAALVADIPGLTRDRRYGWVEYETDNEERGQWLLIDTGGMVFSDSTIDRQVLQQANIAIDESDLVCLVVSVKEGLVPLDWNIVEKLRRTQKPIWLIVNKLDGYDENTVIAEFAEVGLGKMFCVTALGKRRMKNLTAALTAEAIKKGTVASSKTTAVKIAFVGRPNAGKSTLINQIIGSERFITSSESGTTRDSVEVEFENKGHKFSLVDTAGVKRKKSTEGAETLSILHTLEQTMRADVVVLVCDAVAGATRQDAILAGRVLEAGRALVVVLNKMDEIAKTQQYSLRYSVDTHLGFLRGFDVIDISALKGDGVGRVLTAAWQATKAATIKVSTAHCNRLLKLAQLQHQPARIASGVAKLRFVHQGGSQPPRFIVYGSRVESLQEGYRRYLENFFRKKLKLKGTPVFFEFQQTPNPYAKEQTTKKKWTPKKH